MYLHLTISISCLMSIVAAASIILLHWLYIYHALAVTADIRDWLKRLAADSLMLLLSRMLSPAIRVIATKRVAAASFSLVKEITDKHLNQSKGYKENSHIGQQA